MPLYVMHHPCSEWWGFPFNPISQSRRLMGRRLACKLPGFLSVLCCSSDAGYCAKSVVGITWNNSVVCLKTNRTGVTLRRIFDPKQSRVSAPTVIRVISNWVQFFSLNRCFPSAMWKEVLFQESCIFTPSQGFVSGKCLQNKAANCYYL